MGTALDPQITEAIETTATVTVTVDPGLSVTGTLMSDPIDYMRVIVVEVGTNWVTPAFYRDQITRLVWE